MTTTRRNLGRLALAGAIAAGALPASGRRSLAVADERTAIEEAVEDLRGAILAADAGRLQDLLAEQLSYGLWPGGRVQDKTAFIGTIADKHMVYRSIGYADTNIAVAGNNAIVRHSESVVAEGAGKPYAFDFSELQVWQKQRDRWRLLVRQGFPT